MRALVLVLLLVAGTGLGAVAQEIPEVPGTEASPAPSSEFREISSNTGRLVSSIVTIEREALFAQSEFGQRIQKELEQDTEALAAENRRIEGELIAEEKELTGTRATISVEEFTPLAEAFDQKVQRIRNEQDQKSILLQQRLDQQRQTFLESVSPILGEIAQSRGAVAVLDRNLVLLAFEGIDITQEAISLIDARLGENSPGQLTPTTPMPRPQTGEADPENDPER